MLDDAGKTTVRLTLERPELLASDGTRTPLETRLRVRPVLGYDAELAATLTALDALEGVAAAARSRFDEAARAAGRRPAGVSTKVDVPLAAELEAGAAARVLLARGWPRSPRPRCLERSPTSTRSSCTTSGWPSAAPAPCCASCNRASQPSRRDARIDLIERRKRVA